MKRNTGRKYLLLFVFFPLLLSLAACKWEQKHELSRNREKWQAQNITNYQYKVSIISSWGANQLMPLTMVYQNGQLVSVVDHEGNVQELYWDTLGGIDAIFQEVDDAWTHRKRDATEITYDPTYGFPTYVDIFYHETGVGGEYTKRYAIRDFEVLTGP